MVTLVYMESLLAAFTGPLWWKSTDIGRFPSQRAWCGALVFLCCQFKWTVDLWWSETPKLHYRDVIMWAMASQITSLTIVYSTVYSSADQRKYQSSASLAFVWEIHRRPVNSPHKWPVTRKMLPFDDVIMDDVTLLYCYMNLPQRSGISTDAVVSRGLFYWECMEYPKKALLKRCQQFRITSWCSSEVTLNDMGQISWIHKELFIVEARTQWLT